MSDRKRPYRLQKRAETQEETRRRIVDAAVALHQDLGPAQTSLSAVAERAGVQRATLYKHFPEERDLLLACSGHYFASHPPPDPTPWLGIQDPSGRLRAALTDLYAYYDRTEPMTSKAIRDAPFKPVLQEIAARQVTELARLVPLLAAGWTDDSQRAALLGAALGHALDFRTWHALSRDRGLPNADILAMMLAMVRGVTGRDRAA